MINEIIPPDHDIFYINTSNEQELTQSRLLSYIVDHGRADQDLTIFFAHGAGGNKNQWRRQWRHLTGRGYRLVAWDNLGHGRSTRSPRRTDYAGARILADYRALFERFASRRNILVAHSYGTRLTLGLLAELEAAGRLESVAGALLLGVPPVATPLAFAPRLLPTFALEWMRPFLTRSFRSLAWHPDTDAGLIDIEEEATRGNSLFMMRALLEQDFRPDPATLPRLAIPIDVVAGDADRLTPADHGRDLAARLPDGRLHLLTGSGHQIMLEQPDGTNALLDALIAGDR
ncbi:MAG: alpha/beta hydrolase [Telmatospirillum sp.]|nr:alpha/beta hydrolase [Telmatospirillum sp.]